MEKIEKALMVVYTAAIPCILLLVAVSLQMEGKRGIGIMALALCFLLEFIRYLLSCAFTFRQEEVKEDKVKITDFDKHTKLVELLQEQKHEIKRLECQIELQKDLFDKWRKILEKRLEVIEKNVEFSEKKEETSNNKADESTQERDIRMYMISLDTAELENKKELKVGDCFRFYQNGKGKYQLNNRGELSPSFLKVGGIFTKEMYEIFKAQNMGKVFMLNSQEVINHKILEIDPAKISLKHNDKSDNKYYGTIIEKGRIKVECSL